MSLVPFSVSLFQDAAKLCPQAWSEACSKCNFYSLLYYSMELCCKPWVHDSPRASICHQGTEASLLELRRFMTLGGLGVPDSPNTTGWPPPTFQGLAHMDLRGKQPHLQKAWFLEI